MPTNIYGPGDNFDLETSHVLPALIHRFHDAKESGAASVTLWGDGSALREFLYSEDLAAATMFLLDNYDEPGPINVGFGEDLSIRDLAGIIAGVVGYEGSIEWDTSKPNGTPRKILDSERIRQLGWKPQVELVDGIQRTYASYLAR